MQQQKNEDQRKNETRRKKNYQRRLEEERRRNDIWSSKITITSTMKITENYRK